ncbi:NACHT domain-containing protein [Paracnuella aquatica]|uniref:NACHT domain-containing protein n=1 Tax=Paracnuella aquatica TaxID=2268757 RepID=UPI000DEF0104|nr:NACHT domain-containing protein [Paracnuella aquatica]RPD44414.1 NACHT domain-containing protein [Paracnuella aquatica]
MDGIVELINLPLAKIWNTLEQHVKQTVSNRLLEYQVEEFERNYYTKTIIHRIEPVKLNDFYQPLFLRKNHHPNSAEKISTATCQDLFANGRFITIIGTAGSGKSTIVKHLVVQAIESAYKIPIKIELRYLNNYNGSLHKFIEDEIFKLEQLAFDQKIIHRLLLSGNFLFFFDGYDELNSSVKDRITKDINDFTKVYNKNCFIITSRPYTNIELLSKFKNLQVCELTGGEIEQFVRKQIPPQEKEIATKIIEAIASESNKSYMSYLTNPLLLSMFILTFQTYSDIPIKKSTFYKQVFDSLFYLHDSISKLSWSREKTCGLNKEQFEHILKLFSFITYFKEIFVFNEGFLYDMLSQIKEKKKTLQFDSQKLVNDLQVAICILNKEGLDYVFPHRSLQEYFASLYVVSLEEGHKREIYQKICNEIWESGNRFLPPKENFYTLLLEQDPINVIRYISIPFIKQTYSELQGRWKKSHYEHIYSVYFFSVIFSSQSRNLELIFEKISLFYDERHKIVMAAHARNQKEIKFTQEENKLEKKQFAELRKDIVPLFPRVLEELTRYLEEEEESDLKIIDMI